MLGVHLVEAVQNENKQAVFLGGKGAGLCEPWREHVKGLARVALQHELLARNAGNFAENPHGHIHGLGGIGTCGQTVGEEDGSRIVL